jgi:hypothetical protein
LTGNSVEGGGALIFAARKVAVKMGRQGWCRRTLPCVPAS